MNIKKIGVITGSLIGVLYVLFLVFPFCLNGLVNSYNEDIAKAVENASGFKLKLDNIKLVTTPKLTAGVKVRQLILQQPDGEEILNLSNADAKLSLLPLLIKRIEADVIQAENLNVSLKVQKDGTLYAASYLPDTAASDDLPAVTALPYGFKLSNHLPDIKVKKYNFALVDMRNNKKYSVTGNDFKLTDFILNKKLKVSTAGSVNLDGTVPFNYNVKVFNRVMPDIDLNDLVFNNNSTTVTQNVASDFNIIDILEAIKKNRLTADLYADVKTSGDFNNITVNGLIDLEKLSLAVNDRMLPEGHAKLDFKGTKLISDIALYTSDNEATTIIGELNSKSKKINLAFKSNAQINNIINIVKSAAASIGCNDFQTLSATGVVDADFTLKSDMKKFTSDGYFKIPNASIKYGLYNILIDKINADVDFAGDILDLKNIGFEILSQPLKVYGTIKSDTATDIHLTADRLPIKGLVAAIGQAALFKDNDFKSGVISFDASVQGKLKEIKPNANLTVENFNILNKPLSLNVKLPKAKITLDTKDVKLDDTYVLFDNSRIDLSGNISDYTSKNLAVNLKAQGNIIANDLKMMLPVDMRSMVAAKGSIPLLVTVSGNDKKQIVDAQLLAVPSGYFRVAEVAALNGKSTLIRSEITITGNSLKFADSGIYSTSATAIPVSVSNASPLVSLKGSVDNISNPHLNLNIATESPQSISIPGFDGSKVLADANVAVKGNVAAPSLKGQISLPEVNIPSLKTNLKNILVELGAKSISVNLPSIIIDNSVMNAKALISPNFGHGVVVQSVDFRGDLIDADTLAAAANSSSVSSSNSSAPPADLGVIVKNGKGTVNKFKSGNIIATNLSSDFGLKNNIFYLKNLKGDAFTGKFNGDISVNILSGKTGVKISGNSMKAVDAIEGAAAISNALSGTLGFNADLNLNAFAPSYNALLNSISGNVTFDVKDGHYANIGRLDNLLLAQNLAANTILKAAIAPVRNMPIIQNASEFKSITGDIMLKNGIANLKTIKSAGPSMAYFVSGSYNLVSGYTNVIVLGRLGADVVAALGPLGQLSASKLTAYLPKFGAQTLNLLNAITSNPVAENTSQIPPLTNGQANTKDFKVVFTGNVAAASSIKSFKWLSTCDISEISGGTLKEQLQNSTDVLKNSGKSTVQDVKKSVENVKDAAKTTADDIKNQVQKTKDSIQDLKNLKNIFKSPTTNTTP